MQAIWIIAIYGVVLATVAFAATRLDEWLAKRRTMARPRKGPAVRLVSETAAKSEGWWDQYDPPACWRKGLHPETALATQKRRSGHKRASTKRAYEVIA